MKFQATFVLLIIIELCFSAPVSPGKNKDKLSFLDEQGYEVVSDAEEILTPVSPDLDNGVHLSGSDIINSKMLLYGRFYVLRKKGNSDGKTITEVLKTDQLLKRYRNTRPETDYRPIRHNPQESPMDCVGSPMDSIIFFPDDETKEKTSTAKKYIRQGTPGPIGGNDGNEATTKPYIWKTRPTRAGNGQDIDETPKLAQASPALSFTPAEISKEMEHMSQEQFVAWAKANLNPDKLAYFLEQAMEENDQDSAEDGEVTTALPGIQYNSFILVPGLKCQEGQRVNHRGTCTPKYVHVPSKHDALILRKLKHHQTKRRLQEFVKTLFQLALEVEELEKLESEATTTVSSTTSLSIDGDPSTPTVTGR